MAMISVFFFWIWQISWRRAQLVIGIRLLKFFLLKTHIEKTKQVIISHFDNRNSKYDLQFFEWSTLSVNNEIYFLGVTQGVFAQNIFNNYFQFSQCNSIALQISKAHLNYTVLKVIKYNFGFWVLATSIFLIF